MTIKAGNVSFELVRIPAGRFSMGSATGIPMRSRFMRSGSATTSTWAGPR